MLLFLRAGIVAGRRQIIAVIAISVLAFIFVPDRIAVPNSPVGSGPIDQFAVSMSLSLTLAYLVTSVGFALTFDLTVDLTAKRMRHAGRLLDSPDQNVGLATQFVVVAIILFSFALRGPPELLVEVSRLLGCTYAAPLIWVGTLSIAIASLGASAHAAILSCSSSKS